MISYQDRNKTLTAEELRRRYNLDALEKDRKAISIVKGSLTKIESDQESILKSIIVNLGSTLESQSDISLWFFDGIPTLETLPTTQFTDYDEHLGDIYYDKQTGFVYIFAKTGNVYEWIRNNDSSLIQAMSLTNAALDTTDNTRQVFFTTPVTPYECGDWYIDENMDLYICQIAKASTEVYEENDFIIASKFTDDTLARKNAGAITIISGQVTIITESIEAITQTIEDNRYYEDENGDKHLISTAMTNFTQEVDNISTTVSDMNRTITDQESMLEAIQGDVTTMQTQFVQDSNSFNARITELQQGLNDANDLISQNETEQSKYLRYYIDSNNHGTVELGESDSAFKTKLTNEKLSFTQDDNEVAYVSNNKLFITTAEILTMLLIGNFGFTPLSNGSVTFGKVK